MGGSPGRLAFSAFVCLFCLLFSFVQGWWGKCAESLNIILAVLELRPGWPCDFRKPSWLPHAHFLLYNDITMAD